MKKIIALVLALVLTVAASVAGTVAYLQAEDSDVNVMTLGNVKIEQIEQEYNAEGKLVDFTQAKPLYPYVGEFGWENTETGNGAYRQFTMANVVDKYVSVKNTGKSDAYVRTLIALEMGDYSYDEFDMVGISINSVSGTEFKFGGTWAYDSTKDFVAEIDGKNYYVMEFVHQNPVEPGDTTIPSLLQVYLSKDATNETVEKLDGNDNGTYEILVASQAIQTKGFTDAKTALDAGFGAITATNHPWVDGVVVPDHFVGTLDELKAAFAKGGNIQLTDDIKLEKITPIEPGVEVYLDLNGKTITVDENTTSNTLIWVQDGAKLTVDGNGTIDLGAVSTMAIFCPYGELVIENGTFTRDKVTTVTDATTGLFMGAKNSGCNVTINGGYFDPGYYDTNAADIEDILAGTATLTETADDIAKRGLPGDKNLVRMAIKDNVSVVLNHSGYGSFKVYGGTFVGANPAWGDEGCMLPTTPNYLRPWSYYQGALLAGQTFNENGLVLPDGYTSTRTVNADGVPVYTVNYSK